MDSIGLADKLIQKYNKLGFELFLEKVSNSLDIEVMIALRKKISAMARQQGHAKAIKLLPLTEIVAQLIGTQEAYIFVIWIKGNISLYSNHYQKALTCFQEAENFFKRNSNCTVELTAMQINQVVVFRELGNYKESLRIAQEARKNVTIQV